MIITLLVAIVFLGLSVGRRLFDKRSEKLRNIFQSINTGSVWEPCVDVSGWPLPSYSRKVTVIDKYYDSKSKSYVIKCSTENNQILSYLLEDFILGKKIS